MYCSNLRKGIDKRTTPAYNILVIKSVLFQGGVKVSTGSIRGTDPDSLRAARHDG